MGRYRCEYDGCVSGAETRLDVVPYPSIFRDLDRMRSGQRPVRCVRRTRGGVGVTFGAVLSTAAVTGAVHPVETRRRTSSAAHDHALV